MGRPKDDRTRVMTLRLTDEERDLLEVIATDHVVGAQWLIHRALRRYLIDLDADMDIAPTLSDETRGAIELFVGVRS